MKELKSPSVFAMPAFSGRKKHLLNRINQIILGSSIKTSSGKFLASVGLFFFILALSIVFSVSADGFEKGIISCQNFHDMFIYGATAQQDTMVKPVLNAYVKSKIPDPEKNNEKEVHILFRNDTVVEITVNGEKIGPDKIHEYDKLVEGIRENYRESVENLEEIEGEMAENQSKLEEINPDQCTPDFYSILKEIQISFDEALQSLQNFSWNRNIREALEQARHESRIAMDQLSQEDLSQLQNAVKKAQEEARRSLSELRRQHPGGYHFEFYIPPVFDPPCPRESINHEEKNSESSSSLESKLEKMEKNK